MTDNSDKNDFKAAQHFGEQMRQEAMEAGYTESVNSSEKDLYNFYEANCNSVEAIKSVLEFVHSYNPQAASFYLYGPNLKPEQLADVAPMSYYGSSHIPDYAYNFLLSHHNREMLCAVLDVTSVGVGVLPGTDIRVFEVTF